MTISIEEAARKPQRMCEMRDGEYALVLENYGSLEKGDVILRLPVGQTWPNWKTVAAAYLIISNGKPSGTSIDHCGFGAPILNGAQLRILPPRTIISITVLGEKD